MDKVRTPGTVGFGGMKLLTVVKAVDILLAMRGRLSVSSGDVLVEKETKSGGGCILGMAWLLILG